MWAKQKGFTIVELLIVIVIIAILAAIVIVAYNGVQERAQESSVRTDMTNIAKQVELYRVDEGRYPTINRLTELGIKVNKQTYGVNPTGATIFYCVNDSGGAFSIVNRVKSAKLLQYASPQGDIRTYAGTSSAPELCVDSGVTGDEDDMNFIGFTENGAWKSWVSN